MKKFDFTSALVGVAAYIAVKKGAKYLLNNTSAGQKTKSWIEEKKAEVMRKAEELQAKAKKEACEEQK